MRWFQQLTCKSRPTLQVKGKMACTRSRTKWRAHISPDLNYRQAGKQSMHRLHLQPPSTRKSSSHQATPHDSIRPNTSTACSFLEEMAAAIPSPVEVGARGTIGSLVSQEIEYFRRLNRDGHEVHIQKQQKVNMDEASTSAGSKQKSSSSRVVHKKKKKLAAPGGFLPSICSAVDVTDASRVERIAGIGYRNLRSDGKKLSEE